MLEKSHTGFPDTRWSMIDRLAKGSDQEQQDAAEYLAEMYWPAVYSFLRQSGKNQNDASELTQAFFSDVVFQRQLFLHADASAGSLRRLVLSALKNFLIDQHRRRKAELKHWRITAEQAANEDRLNQTNNTNPESAFVRRWAMAVLEDAITRCAEHYAKTGKPRHWSAFEMRVVRPSLMMHNPPSYENIAIDTGFRDAGACITAVRVVRKRFIAMIRQILAESSFDSQVQNAEFQDILSLMGKAS